MLQSDSFSPMKLDGEEKFSANTLCVPVQSGCHVGDPESLSDSCLSMKEFELKEWTPSEPELDSMDEFAQGLALAYLIVGAGGHLRFAELLV